MISPRAKVKAKNRILEYEWYIPLILQDAKIIAVNLSLSISFKF